MFITLMYFAGTTILIFTIVSIILLSVEERKIAQNPIPRLNGKGEENLFGDLKKAYVHKVYRVVHGK